MNKYLVGMIASIVVPICIYGYMSLRKRWDEHRSTAVYRARKNKTNVQTPSSIPDEPNAEMRPGHEMVREETAGR
jgi:hypothetical protein